MKIQSVKHSLLATIVIGALGMSSAAMAQNDLVVKLTAKVQETTCDINPAPGVNGSTIDMGTYAASDLATLATGGNVTIGKGSTYGVLDVPGAAMIVNVSNCTGAPVAGGSSIDLEAQGPAAWGAAQDDLYGDAAVDQGFGYGIKYEVLGGGAQTGYITPSTPKVPIMTAAGATSDMTPANAMSAQVKIIPQIVAYGKDESNYFSGNTVASVITFNIAEE